MIDLAITLILAFIVFSILARIAPCNKDQPFIRKGMVTDLLYRLISPFFSRFVSNFFLAIGFSLLFYGEPINEIGKYIENGHGYLGSLPLYIQAAAVFIISDFLLYWTHRFFHNKTLWKWHAIHHSSETVDWLSTFRFHPVNIWLSFTAVDALIMIVGFSPKSIAIMALFNTIYSFMVHANLNWTFGSFRYVFASPVFHRWHHSNEEEALDKNFAPTFPLLDVMFGTFYMPEGKLPQHYGVNGMDIPESFIGQIAFPFIEKNTSHPPFNSLSTSSLLSGASDAAGGEASTGSDSTVLASITTSSTTGATEKSCSGSCSI